MIESIVEAKERKAIHEADSVAPTFETPFGHIPQM
jgi:hypothetical protein